MLTKEQILNNLKRLGEELKALDLHGEIIITGGASMCLVHSARDMTKDIDAIYEPKTVINELVEKIAKEYNLSADWLNDSVKGFVNKNIETVEFGTFGNLKIATVTPNYLLAMKLLSARVTGQDYNDIKFLLKKLNITTTDEAYRIIEKVFPVKLILPKTMYVLEQCLEEISDEWKPE
ncbi:MAG: DUF6036 family nucleotidyltransferase [Tissierellaceae bacterium]